MIGWAGPRGVVTLAAAFLIPVGVPEREILILAAMVVTAGTLLLQGLTLPALVRALKLRGPDARSDALQAATVLQTASIAGLAALDRAGPTDGCPRNRGPGAGPDPGATGGDVGGAGPPRHR